MQLRNLINILLFCFLMIVPLVPIKIKLSFIPLSADFILGSIIIILTIVYFLRNYRTNKFYHLFKTRELLLLIITISCYTLSGALSVFYSADKGAAISELLRFFEYICLFYSILIVSDKLFIERSIFVYVCVMIVASLIGAAQFIFNWSEFVSPGMPFSRGRIYATFVNPNYWGAAVNLVIFYPLLKLVEERKNILMNTVIFLLFMFNLILCFTRGSWIGFAVGVLIICLVKYKRALLLIPVLSGAMFLLPFTRIRFISMFSFKGESNAIRLKLWKTGWVMFKENFWLGVGNGNYLHYYNDYITKYPQLNFGEVRYSVHNSYIKTLSELGIIGGILFIIIYLMLGFLVFKSYRNINNNNVKIFSLAVLAFWGAYLVQNFFNNLIFIPQLNVLVWIITALVYKYYLIEKQERNYKIF